MTNQVSCRNALNFAPQDRAALMNRGPSVMGLKVADDEEAATVFRVGSASIGGPCLPT